MLLLNILISLAFSLERTKSFVCPEQTLSPGITNSAQIVCCDNDQGATCAQTTESHLSPYQINLLENSSLEILELPEDIMVVKNCFKTALELVQQPILSHAIDSISPGDLMRSLDTSYIEITDGSRQVGDVLVFEEYGQYLYAEDREIGPGKTFTWGEGNEIIHAAVYVGNNLLVQKENTFSAVMSISAVHRAQARYAWGAMQTQKTDLYSGKKTQVRIKTFRKVK